VKAKAMAKARACWESAARGKRRLKCALIHSKFAICKFRIANFCIFDHLFEKTMRTHRGMRPQDIVILLKIIQLGNQPWTMRDLSIALQISASEVSESLSRSSVSGLIHQNKKEVNADALLGFLQHGLRFVFPQQPGASTRGVPTAHSAPPLNATILSQETYVWPHHEGNTRGQAIEPLIPSIPQVCSKDKALHELLALCDALRVGKVRERQLALKELSKRLHVQYPHQ
jgi:hypothetical protein